MPSIQTRISEALANPITDHRTIDPMRELRDVLAVTGHSPEDAGGAIRFEGRDPIISSPWPLATMAGVSLMAKAVAMADLWRVRTGEAQDLSVDLRQVLHRLCPFYDKKWELLNGYAPGAPSDPANPFSCPVTCTRRGTGDGCSFSIFTRASRPRRSPSSGPTVSCVMPPAEGCAACSVSHASSSMQRWNSSAGACSSSTLAMRPLGSNVYLKPPSTK